MVIKVYISSVTCNNQQRKNQHTILSKLQAEKVDFIKIDVTDPKHNQEKLHMRELSKSRKEGTFAVPPQIFNDSEYCGDYEAFADALETQNLWEFLKMKELQDQLKQKIEDDDSLIGFNKEGEEEKKDEEGGEKTKEAIIEEEEKVVEEAKEGDEEEKKKEKEDTKETEADEKTNEEVEKKEEVFADNEQLETQVEESEVMKNAEPSKIVEFVNEESSKISEELARNTLTEVQEFVVKKELPNTLRSLRRIILNEESLAQKYAGPMEQENESKENKEPLEQELLEEVIEEVLQSSSVKCKRAMKCVGREEIQYLIRKEEGDKETEKKIVNDNVCSESDENVNKNREDKEEVIEFQNLNERLDEASGVVNYTEDLKNERKDIENTGNLDKREVNKYTELLVDKEFSEDAEPHSDDTNDNVELFEEKVKEYILIGEREFMEDSNLLVEKSDVEDEKTTDPVIDEEKDITEYSNNLRDRNIYEGKQEDGEMEDISDDDDDKENNQSLQHSEHLDEEYAEDFEEEEMAELQDGSEKEQIEKDAVPRDTEYLEKEGEFLDSSLSEVLHTNLARNDSVDNIEGNEKFAQLIPTDSKEGQEQSNETSKEDMEFGESVELETDKFFNKENLSEAKESEESEQKTEIEEKVDKTEVEEEKKTEESENQE